MKPGTRISLLEIFLTFALIAPSYCVAEESYVFANGAKLVVDEKISFTYPSFGTSVEFLPGQFGDCILLSYTSCAGDVATFLVGANGNPFLVNQNGTLKRLPFHVATKGDRVEKFNYEVMESDSLHLPVIYFKVPTGGYKLVIMDVTGTKMMSWDVAHIDENASIDLEGTTLRVDGVEYSVPNYVFKSPEGSAFNGPFSHDQRGLFYRLPEARTIHIYSGTVLGVHSIPLALEGKNFWLVKGIFRNRFDEWVVLLVREDGRYVVLGRRMSDVSLSEPVTRDGIFEVPPLERRVDLRAFEQEQLFVPDVAQPVMEEDAGEITNLQRFVLKFSPDIVSEVGEDGLDPDMSLVSEDIRKQIDSVVIALNRKETGNVVLLGKSGVGKTVLVKTLARLIAKGKLAQFPRSVQILNVSAHTFVQGGKYVGTIETRLSAILEYCRRARVVLFIDELHRLRGAGTYQGNANDLLEHLKTNLATGELRVIGTDTHQEFQEAFGTDRTIQRRFTTIEVPEPKGNTLMKMLRAWVQWKYPKHRLDDHLLAYAVGLVSSVNAHGAQPAKTVQFLDHVLSSFPSGSEGEINFTDLNRAAVDLFKFDKRLFEVSGPSNVVAQLADDTRWMETGMAQYKGALTDLYSLLASGMKDSDRPASLLVIGPPGTGKTSIAKRFAEIVMRSFKRMEMAHYSLSTDPHDFLSGLGNLVSTSALAVILLDEIERASPSVQSALFAVLDSGTFSSLRRHPLSGSTWFVDVDARNIIFVATANSQESIIEPLLDRFQQRTQTSLPNRDEFRAALLKHLDDLRRNTPDLIIEPHDGHLESLIDKHFGAGSSYRSIEPILMEIKLMLARERIKKGNTIPFITCLKAFVEEGNRDPLD